MRRALHGRLVTRRAGGSSTVRRSSWPHQRHSNSLECPFVFLHPATITDVVVYPQSESKRQSLFLHSLPFDTSSASQFSTTGWSIPLRKFRQWNEFRVYLFILFVEVGWGGGSSSSCEEWTWWTCVWREEKEAASPVCCYIWKRTSSFNFLIYLILLCYWDPFSRNHNITVTNSLVHVHLQLLYLSNIYSIYYQYRVCVCVYICNKDPPDDIRNYVYCSIDAFIFYSVSDLSNGDS